MDWIKAIKERYSCRNYEDKKIDPGIKKQVEDFISGNKKCFFGNRAYFKIIDMTEADAKEMKELGSYGVLKGVKVLISGAVNNAEFANEDYGYLMEKNILFCASLGLGTCWLGGSFDRAAFTKKTGIKPGEIVPAITPIGYAVKKKTIEDIAIRKMVGADKRKKWKELFFMGDDGTELKPEEAGKYKDVIEMVRIGPSASNKQPWRVVKEKGKSIFHFFLERTPGYGDKMRPADMQKIDMGIAMCHFELSCGELGLTGKFERMKNIKTYREWEYIVSWKE